MNKILTLVRLVIVGGLVLTSIPLVITYLAEIERPHEFMMVLHVIFGILFILVAIPITVREKRLQQKRK